MKQYIDKANVVAKIDDRRDKIIKGIATIPLRGRQRADAALEYEILGKVREFLSTLEVKEVDLEKEIDDFMAKEWNGVEEDKDLYDMIKNDLSDIAKHFFELGLKAQIMTSKLQQRISVLKMDFWTGLQTFNESEMTLSDAYNQGVDDILEELGIKAQKGERV